MENTINSVFQISILSQNDPPDQCCAGCAVGAEIYAFVFDYGGCNFLSAGSNRAGYPASNEELRKPVLLPVPADFPPPTPTWFFEVTNGIDNAWVDVLILTPGQLPCIIRINGANMELWVADNTESPTNQIYSYGNCGIFGYAQENNPGDSQPVYWIYTLTAGVCNPHVHPTP
jgi:hypothetical protein